MQNGWDKEDDDEIEEIEEVDNKGKRKRITGIKMEELGGGRYRFSTMIKCPDSNCEKCKKGDSSKIIGHSLVVEIDKALSTP